MKFCEASVSAQSSTSMRVLRSASLLLGIRGTALDVESSAQRPWEGRDLCWAPVLSVSGARRSLCRARALSVLGLGALRVGPGTRCVWAPALSVSGPGALRVRARRSLFQGLALSVLGPRSVGPRRSCCLCRVSALSVLGPSALCVGPQRSLCRGLALSDCVRVRCRGAPGRGALCVGARRSLCAGPQLRPACHPSGPRPLALIRVPHIRCHGPQLKSVPGSEYGIPLLRLQPVVEFLEVLKPCRSQGGILFSFRGTRRGVTKNVCNLSTVSTLRENLLGQSSCAPNTFN